MPATAAATRGFRTVTPYLIARDVPALLEFLAAAFGATETHRAIGGAGGLHVEVRIGDSMLMVGGGAPGLSWRGDNRPTAIHLYVEDVDATFRRAVAAGAISTGEPQDHNYGERSGGVRDVAGNEWYIASPQAPDLYAANVFLHPKSADALIDFLQRAVGARVVAKHTGPDGSVARAIVRIGDAPIEMSDAHGPHQPMPTLFFLFAPDVDAAYDRAIAAGARSISAPADRGNAMRQAGVEDPFENQWFFGSQLSG